MFTHLFIAIVAIIGLVLLILRLKVNPFIALLLVTIGVAVAAGMPPAEIGTNIEEALGKSLGHIALIIALGAMIGRLIEESGGAHALAVRLVERFGTGRVPLALAITGFVVGIPVFFEVAIVMLMPLAANIARDARMPLRAVALPMCGIILVAHALLPPHPGMVAVGSELGVPLGRLLFWGLGVAALTAAWGYGVARFLNRKCLGVVPQELPLEPESPPQNGGAATAALPGWATIAALIAMPIALILGATVAAGILPAGHPVRSVLSVMGNPFVALLLDVLLCSYVLGIRKGWSLEKAGAVAGSALPPMAIVILVTGAGGAFAKILVQTGIGNAVSLAIQSTGLPVLAVCYVLALLLRAAQGPTTIALMATVGIVSPVLAGNGYSPDQLALACLAMGAGGLGASHVNDPGFWVVTRLIGLDVGQGLRSWTVLTTCCSVFAFALVALAWQFV